MNKIRVIREYYCSETDHRCKIVRERFPEYDIWSMYAYMVPNHSSVNDIDPSRYSLKFKVRRKLGDYPDRYEMEAGWVFKYRENSYDAV